VCNTRQIYDVSLFTLFTRKGADLRAHTGGSSVFETVPSDGKICNLTPCFDVIDTRGAKGTKNKSVKKKGRSVRDEAIKESFLC
jgi:hypothetical protein